MLAVVVAADVRLPTFAPMVVGADVPALEPPAALLITWLAAMLRLPETRIPASPASPVANPDRSVCTAALCGSISTRVGDADLTVLDDDPASILPCDDQMISSPPRSVKIRPMPMLTSLRAKIEILPPPSVMIPGGGWVLQELPFFVNRTPDSALQVELSALPARWKSQSHFSQPQSICDD